MADLVLYDILGGDSTAPIAWAPNVWIVRYALHFKGLKYITEWVEFPDIESTCKKIGAGPTRYKDDGITPHYTLPVMYDASTSTVISDSTAIIAYLDKTYPQHPRVIPPEMGGLYAAFQDTVDEAFAKKAYRLTVYPTARLFGERGLEYYTRTREAVLGMKLEEAAPPGSKAREKTMQELEDGLRRVAGWYDKARPRVDGGEGSVVFIHGTQSPCFADLFVAVRLLWLKIGVGEGSEVWSRVLKLDQGRWAKFVEWFASEGYNVGQ
ncbi:hypothetical protein BXZ70DRAFT_540065 [Cristinia sonorae]|uniref:GST N-terminal domain-containing protein n=1 Tax=Cristinia sonorae TaxID=1940300 RepID=A0A8K0UH31_9AGAR|nr:hypothetical protein BXZ70DRAFT_540065 [Cristinia sonorae]